MSKEEPFCIIWQSQRDGSFPGFDCSDQPPINELERAIGYSLGVILAHLLMPKKEK